MTKLTDIKGLDDQAAARLTEAGITNADMLLDAGGTPEGRKDLAARTGLEAAALLGWLNRVDLARVKGIGREYSDLLEACGVDTVPELAQRNATNLHAKMVTVNEEQALVKALPSENQVADWVVQAKALPRAISY